jgi:DNA-directed RNA polymerases I, II, and III subunit RPABC3
MASEITLLDEMFRIDDVDSSKYDKGTLPPQPSHPLHSAKWLVSRIKGSSQSSDLNLILDINSEIFPLQKDEVISLNLSSSLRLDGKEDKGWRDLGRGEASLADDYDYVCYGKVYRFDEGVKGTDRVYIPTIPLSASLLFYQLYGCI